MSPETEFRQLIQVSLSIMMDNVNFETESGKLCFHRQSLRGMVQDYVITFKEDSPVIEVAAGRGLDLFCLLVEHFKEYKIKARLIAQIQFIRLNQELEPMEKVDYHFTSYRQEVVVDAKEFFQRHMCKIASRLDAFNEHGSRLLIDHLRHLHIALSLLPKCMTD